MKAQRFLEKLDRCRWQDREDMGLEFARLLGSAQEGGATISECLLTASRIERATDDRWHSEWERTADANNARGNAAFSRGHLLTAKSNWLRAINYYQAAAFHLDPADARYREALGSMRSCARRYLELLGGEVVTIPALEDHPLEGYFLPAPEARNRSSVVVCIGDPGHRKEEFLYKTARYAADRGMSLLAVDLLGHGTGIDYDEIFGRSDLEATVGRIVDYLETRGDVDPDRIAIFGDGFGSSFVARGVAFDARFAAAVCDGGVWDLHEREFLMDRISPCTTGGFENIDGGSIARKFKCPVLITAGEHGWLDVDRVTDLVHKLREDHRDIALKIFRGSETAASQGHLDNPTLANEYIFDWIANQLGVDAGIEAADAGRSLTPNSNIHRNL
jgi:dienelactone hydrolase